MRLVSPQPSLLSDARRRGTIDGIIGRSPAHGVTLTYGKALGRLLEGS